MTWIVHCKRCGDAIHPVSLDCNCIEPWWRRKRVVSYAPVGATVLLEYANVGQLWRMWTTHTAAGQSVSAWFAVFVALGCYYWFYKICCPDQKWARRMTVLGMAMNLAVCGTVLYFRYRA